MDYTNGDIGLFILRIVISIIFFYHAAPKLGSPKAMSTAMGWPTAGVFILGLIEALSAVALLTGTYAQVAAILLSIIMLGAIGTKIIKWNTGFSSMKTTGWEFDLMILSGLVTLILVGAGTISIDYLLLYK